MNYPDFFVRIQNLVTILENLFVTEKTSQKWRHIHEDGCLPTELSFIYFNCRILVPGGGEHCWNPDVHGKRQGTSSQLYRVRSAGVLLRSPQNCTTMQRPIQDLLQRGVNDDGNRNPIYKQILRQWRIQGFFGGRGAGGTPIPDAAAFRDFCMLKQQEKSIEFCRQ